MGLIHFKGLDNRTYVLSDCKSHETRACGYKYPAKGIYELIYDNRIVRVSKKVFEMVWSSTDPELNNRGLTKLFFRTHKSCRQKHGNELLLTN